MSTDAVSITNSIINGTLLECKWIYRDVELWVLALLLTGSCADDQVNNSKCEEMVPASQKERDRAWILQRIFTGSDWTLHRNSKSSLMTPF